MGSDTAEPASDDDPPPPPPSKDYGLKYVGCYGSEEQLGADKVCRGTRARVTIDPFRQLALQMFKKHRASSIISSNKMFKTMSQGRPADPLPRKPLD